MKNILLIGGSYGIGAAIVAQLQETNKVYVASRTPPAHPHRNLTHITFDAKMDTLDITLLPQTLDGFIYCPGSINLKPFKRLDMEAFEDDMQVNFFGMVKIIKTIIPNMSLKSSMVFFSTVAVGNGMPFHTSIAAAKGAVEGFAKSLAAEYAPKIKVNVIAPSLTNTPLAAKLLNNEKKKESMENKHPLKRIGEAEDIANAAVFLLSDKSSWITGQVIHIDGGLSTLNLN